MQVSEVMSRQVRIANPDDTLQQAARLMDFGRGFARCIPSRRCTLSVEALSSGVSPAVVLG
jgi:hypothetical protein